MSLPRICSGLAYSGVRTRSAVSVRAEASSPARTFAIPKSRSFGTPSPVTRMLAGLMSLWMTSLWCA